MVKYNKLTKAEVLMQLYNFAMYQIGDKDINEIDFNDMTLDTAERLIKRNTVFTCINDRILNVDLSDDVAFDEREYDLINGEMQAQRAIDELVIAKIEEKYLDPQ